MVRTLDPERRQKFLDTARKLFVANGVSNTSTAEIAKEAGTAAGTLFLYFPTKQALIDELILTVAREQSEQILQKLSPALSARDSFLAIWDTTLHWFVDHPEAYRYVRQVRDSGLVSETVVQESNQFFGYYYQAIQKGLAEGVIKPYPVELIGNTMYHQIVAVTDILIRLPDATEHEEFIQKGFDIFWDGIRKRHARE